jgi:GIY-YIG catalytic domain-containing protein
MDGEKAYAHSKGIRGRGRHLLPNNHSLVEGTTATRWGAKAAGRDANECRSAQGMADSGDTGRKSPEARPQTETRMEEGPEAQSGVCGAIEEQRQQIDLLALPYVMLSELAHLPECEGIYFAIEESGELLYVGQSTNIRARWRSHHVKNSLCDPSDLAGARRIRLAWLAVDDAQDLLELEDRFILQFKPRLNRPHISEENKLRASPTQAKSLAAHACYGTTMTATV